MKGVVPIKNPSNKDTPVIYASTFAMSSGTSTEVAAIGVLATDTVVATGNGAKAITLAVPSADKITFTHASATGGEIGSYVVFRNF